MKILFQVFFLLFAFTQCKNDSVKVNVPEETLTVDQRLIQRADSFEFKTPYEPVPGDSMSHHASGFAKILCSAVFITGLDFDFAAENIGYFSAPYAVRAQLKEISILNINQSVSLHQGEWFVLPNILETKVVFV